MKPEGIVAQVAQGINAGLPPPSKQPTVQWDEATALAAIKDVAAQTQDRELALMFGDVVPAQRYDTSVLPSAVDRYLDKILS